MAEVVRGTYYNDHDLRVCEWLRELIKDGLISDGEVDSRSIEEVQSSPVKCEDSDNATSSQVSEDGPMPYDLQAYQTTFLFGQEAAPVNRFRARGDGKDTKTADTSGLPSTVSSQSAVLVRSLESRLIARTDVSGSPEYRLTWKKQDLPSRAPLLTLRASKRRISARGFTGWPTPDATPKDCPNGFNQRPSKVKTNRVTRYLSEMSMLAGLPTPQASTAGNLNRDCKVAGWRSPQQSDGEGGVMEIRQEASGRYKLRDEAVLSGWPTLIARDSRSMKGASRTPNSMGTDPLAVVVATASGSGMTVDGTSAQTELPEGCQLNPRFSLWLQGYPETWASCGVRAMQSYHRLRRSLSKRQSKQSKKPEDGNANNED